MPGVVGRQAGVDGAVGDKLRFVGDGDQHTGKFINFVGVVAEVREGFSLLHQHFATMTVVTVVRHGRGDGSPVRFGEQGPQDVGDVVDAVVHNGGEPGLRPLRVVPGIGVVEADLPLLESVFRGHGLVFPFGPLAAPILITSAGPAGHMRGAYPAFAFVGVGVLPSFTGVATIHWGLGVGYRYVVGVGLTGGAIPRHRVLGGGETDQLQGGLFHPGLGASGVGDVLDTGTQPFDFSFQGGDFVSSGLASAVWLGVRGAHVGVSFITEWR